MMFLGITIGVKATTTGDLDELKLANNFKLKFRHLNGEIQYTISGIASDTYLNSELVFPVDSTMAVLKYENINFADPKINNLLGKFSFDMQI